MKTTQMKRFLGLAFAVALMAGCASTETDDSGQVSGAQGGSTLSGFDGSVSGGDSMSGGAAGAQDGAMGSDMEAAGALETVFYFDFDLATLSIETRQALDAQIARLKSTVGAIRLEGHADERGTREYNIALGERRANAVADYMVLNGISRYRIETVSYGEERPIAMGQDEDSWARNRRVELK